MKRTLFLLALAAAASPLFAQVQVTVSKNLDSTPGMDPIYIQEVKLVKTIQAKDFRAFKSTLLPDFLVVTSTLQNADQFADSLKKCDIGMWSLENKQIRMLSNDAAVINYRLRTNITCGNQVLSGQYNATTIWVLRNGKWLAQMHTETPIPVAQ
jgi:hypothetical protein